MRFSILSGLVALFVVVGCATDPAETAPTDATTDTEEAPSVADAASGDSGASCEVERDQDVPSPGACASIALGDNTVEVQYSSPRANDREIMGGLVPYGEVWRTGANEATVLTTDAPLTIGGEVLPAGTYGMFTIPGEAEWTLIFNSVADQWGAFEYDESQDVLRTVATPAAVDAPQEEFSISFEDASDSAATMVLAWENTRVPVSLSASSN
ncbi:MAG: hypothetical protein Rubg2KO_05380 [Rubricoccaceae bacterium]